MKYYYCVDSDIASWVTYAGQQIAQFIITPADYYDQRGFLSDRYDAVSHFHLPPGFTRCADSRFEYRGTTEHGLACLRASPGFIARDMEKEIAELYASRRAKNQGASNGN